MAIQETNFNNPTIQTVGNWLSENCSQYLNSVDQTASTFIDVCFTADISSCFVRIFIGYSSSTNVPIAILNQSAYTLQCRSKNSNLTPIKGIVTDYGFGIVSSNGYNIWVSKTNNNTPCVVLTHCASSPQVHQIACIDMFDVNISTLLASQYTYTESIDLYARPSLVYKCDKTVLTPVVFDCGSYSPNLLISKFTQSTDFSYRKIKVNNIEFAYDGVFALRG